MAMHSTSRRRGSALILSLLILAALSIMALSFLMATAQRREASVGRTVPGLAQSAAHVAQMYVMEWLDDIGGLDADWTKTPNPLEKLGLDVGSANNTGRLWGYFHVGAKRLPNNASAPAAKDDNGVAMDMWLAASGIIEKDHETLNNNMVINGNIASSSNSRWLYSLGSQDLVGQNGGTNVNLPVVDPTGNIVQFPAAPGGSSPLALLDENFQPIEMAFDAGDDPANNFDDRWIPKNPEDYERVRYAARYAVAWMNLRGALPLTKVVTEPTATTPARMQFSRNTAMNIPGAGTFLDYRRTIFNDTAKEVAKANGGDAGNIVVEDEEEEGEKKAKLWDFGAAPYASFSDKALPFKDNWRDYRRLLFNPFAGAGADFGDGSANSALAAYDNRVDVLLSCFTDAAGNPVTTQPEVKSTIPAGPTGWMNLDGGNGTPLKLTRQIKVAYLDNAARPVNGRPYLVNTTYVNSASANPTTQLNLPNFVFVPDPNNSANLDTERKYVKNAVNGGFDSLYFWEEINSAPAGYNKALIQKEGVVHREVFFGKPSITVDINTAPKDVLVALYIATAKALSDIRIPDPMDPNFSAPGNPNGTPLKDSDLSDKYDSTLTDIDLYPVYTDAFFMHDRADGLIGGNDPAAVDLNPDKVAQYSLTAGGALTQANAAGDPKLRLATPTAPALNNNLHRETPITNTFCLFRYTDIANADISIFRDYPYSGTVGNANEVVLTSADATKWAEAIIAERGKFKPFEVYGAGELATSPWVENAAFKGADSDGNGKIDSARDAASAIIGQILAGLPGPDTHNLAKIITDWYLKDLQKKFNPNGGSAFNFYLAGDMNNLLSNNRLRTWVNYLVSRAYSCAAARLVARNDLFRVALRSQVVEGSWYGADNSVPANLRHSFVLALGEDGKPIVASETNQEFVYLTKQSNPSLDGTSTPNSIQGSILYQRVLDNPVVQK